MSILASCVQTICQYPLIPCEIGYRKSCRFSIQLGRHDCIGTLRSRSVSWLGFVVPSCNIRKSIKLMGPIFFSYIVGNYLDAGECFILASACPDEA